jgi:hypothetical protein
MQAADFLDMLKQSPDIGDVHMATAGNARLFTDFLRPRRKPESLAAQTAPAPRIRVKRGGLASSTFKLSKAEPAKQFVFGWASVVTKDGLLIIDKQDDVILPEDLESAAYDYVRYSRDHGEMHTSVGKGELIESIVFTEEKQKALGIDLGIEGWWAGWHITCKDLWARHERGELPELSIGGYSRTTDL